MRAALWKLYSPRAPLQWLLSLDGLSVAGWAGAPKGGSERLWCIFSTSWSLFPGWSHGGAAKSVGRRSLPWFHQMSSVPGLWTTIFALRFRVSNSFTLIFWVGTILSSTFQTRSHSEFHMIARTPAPFPGWSRTRSPRMQTGPPTSSDQYDIKDKIQICHPF